MRTWRYDPFASWFAVLRIFAGVFWLVHGLPKFLNAANFMPPNGFMPMLVAKSLSSGGGFYHDFLVRAVVPNITLFAELVRLGEVLTGLSLLFGLLTPLGGIIGAFLALNYMAAQGEFQTIKTIGSLDAVAFVMSFLMIVVPAGRIFGLDGLLVRRRVTNRVTPEFVEEP